MKSHETGAEVENTTSTRTLHVVFFLSTLAGVRGGLETIAVNFARALARRGHEMSLVSGSVPGRDLPGDLADPALRWLRVPILPLTLLPWSGASPRSVARRLKLQSLSFAVACRIHPGARRLWTTADVTMSFLEIETVYLSRWRAARGLPHVSYFPGVIDRHWIGNDQSHLRLAISDTVVATTGNVRIDGVVPPGIDESWLHEPYTVRPQVERLLFTGRLHAGKGLAELLQIFTALVQERPALRLRLAGDGPLRRELEGWVARSGLQHQVAFLGAIPAAGVQAELRAADLFLFPTRYESFGIALLEAQAVGVPVVCSDLPITREVSGGAAHLLPPGDVERWIEGVRVVLDEEQRRAQLSKDGRKNAARFTWRRAAGSLERHLLLVCDRV